MLELYNYSVIYWINLFYFTFYKPCVILSDSSQFL